jgi:photosystem II stability/assembly factor-like uncharacterized protein/pimeloyl-ACP methyl ester carboxylesterase
MKKILLFINLLFLTQKSYSQELQRKASLGAQIEQTQNGIKITKVIEGTSKNIKLKENDIILEVNNVKTPDYQSLMLEISSKRNGDKAQLIVKRNNKIVKLNGTYIGRPLEKSDISEVIYDQTSFKNGQLRVIINKPRTSDKLPAMLFVPGYTCSSIDNLTENHPYKRIIDAYIKAGFVTLRIEKSGLGDSYNTPSCESCDLKDEIENFEAGLKKLKSLSFVDTNKIILVGHSMGGIITPALSAKNNVAGVVVYGTTAKSWFEYQIEMYRVQNLLSKMDPIEYEISIREQYELNFKFFVGKEKLEDMAKNVKTDSILKLHWQYDGNGKIFGRNAEYWRQIQDLNHLENWKNTQAKVLVQFGESDFQAFSKEDHEQIVRTVNYYHSNHAILKVFPQTDHYYAKSGSMQEAFDKFNNQQYAQLFEEYNFDVGNSAVEWSLQVINLDNKSENQKYTWKKLKTEAYPGKQDDICFVDEKNGWYINGFGAVYNTKDGGENWDKIFEKKGSFFRTIAFLNQNVGFLGTVGTDYFPNVTDTIPLYKTIDGGKTWNPVPYSGPYVKGLCAIDIVKEAYINHGVSDFKYHIYAVGRVGSPANSIISHDGGETWISKSMNDDCKMLFDIKMFDKNVGFACAATDEDISKSNALILKTTDGGMNWRKVYQSSRPFETTWKVSFPSEKIGYVTIQSYNPDPNAKQQRVAKTIDGGETWFEINLVEDIATREFGIGFLDENHGFVGTMNSGFETKDGGLTWNTIDLGKACNKIRTYKSNNKTFGYSIGVELFKLNF